VEDDRLGNQLGRHLALWMVAFFHDNVEAGVERNDLLCREKENAIDETSLRKTSEEGQERGNTERRDGSKSSSNPPLLRGKETAACFHPVSPAPINLRRLPSIFCDSYTSWHRMEALSRASSVLSGGPQRQGLKTRGPTCHFPTPKSPTQHHQH
jgi:hypothetical protein